MVLAILLLAWNDRALSPERPSPLQRQAIVNQDRARSIAPECRSEGSTTLLPLKRASPLPCTRSNSAGVYTVRPNTSHPGCVDVFVQGNDQQPLGVLHGMKYVDSNCPLVDAHPTISNDR